MTDLDLEAETPSRPLRKDAARNRAALLAAAREVFAERGLEASLDDIAHRAGVGVGTAYRHFANKYELANAIISDAIDEIVTLADECAAMDDAWAGLVRFLEGSCLAQSADRGLHEALMGMHDAAMSEQASQRLIAPLATLVDRAHASGDLRADADVSDVGIMILALTHIGEVTGDASPELWRRYLPMFLDGLRGGSPFPVPPVDIDTMRRSFSNHKQRAARR